MNKDHFQKSIWIADDDDDDRLMIKDAFEELDYKEDLYFFENGEKIIEIINNSKFTKPNLIILDLNMPKIDGYEVLSFIKNNKAINDINVIILTTSKSEEDRSKALSMGAKDFITKPYRFTEMLKIAEDLIKSYG